MEPIVPKHRRMRLTASAPLSLEAVPTRIASETHDAADSNRYVHNTSRTWKFDTPV
jgi:hypothetical protein